MVFSPVPKAFSYPDEENGSGLDRALAAFADGASATGNPLDPVTPMRLAFLTRSVLSADQLPAAAEVFAGLWERRAEIAERVSPALAAYRRAVKLFTRGIDAWGAAWSAGRNLTSASLLVTSGALAYALATGQMVALWRTGAATGAVETIRLVLAGCLVALLLAGMVVNTARRRHRRAQEEYSSASTRFIQGALVKELAIMAGQIIQLKDEQSSGVLLAPMTAPSLVESGTPVVIRSESFREVLALIEGNVSSAVGVVGTRGAGKSTLLRLLCHDERFGPGQLSGIERFATRSADDPARHSARVGVFLTVAADPAEGDFVKVIYATTVRKILASRNVSAGGRRRWRQRLGLQPEDHIALAQQALEQIGGSTSLSSKNTVGLSRFGVSAGFGRQRTWTERELSRADWVAEFRDYLERHRLRGGGPVIIAIDELDKIADAGRAVEIINGLKDLFHIEGVHFVITVSHDALRSFAIRGIPVRDAFDSAFDAVIEIPPMTAAESCELLRARVRYFPYTAALFCHAWSGGLPRDLIRTARSCVAVLNRADTPVPIAELAQGIVRRDMLQFVDAAIRQEGGEDVEQLLELRHELVDGPALPSSVPRAFTLQGPSSNLALSSLAPFLGIATAVGQYFSVPRSTRDWADGLRSGSILQAADLLAQARAALAVHPREAEWQLQRARDALG